MLTAARQGVQRCIRGNNDLPRSKPNVQEATVACVTFQASSRFIYRTHAQCACTFSQEQKMVYYSCYMDKLQLSQVVYIHTCINMYTDLILRSTIT